MAIVAPTTRTSLDALYKVVYPDGGPENQIPDETPFQDVIPFKESTKLGEDFYQPVTLSMSGGVTYGGDQGTNYTLLGSIACVTKKAKIRGSEQTYQETISYGAAKAARGGKESFKDSVGFIFESLSMLGRRSLETSMLHGQSTTGIGVVESIAGAVVTITEASFCPGVFVGRENSRLIAINSGLSSITSAADTQIVSMDLDARQITLSAAGSVAATNVLFWEGSRTASAWFDCLGITTALDTAGTVWNISTSTYNIWKAVEQDCSGGDLSFDLIGKAMNKLFVRGASGKYVCYCAPETWQNLISPEIAVRRHDSSFKPEKVTVGHDAIEFRHMNGTIAVKPHAMMKRSEAIMINPSLWRRIGSSEFTFEQDTGSNVKKIFLHLAGQNGFEVRGYSDQAPFTKRLGAAALFKSIVNS